MRDSLKSGFRRPLVTLVSAVLVGLPLSAQSAPSVAQNLRIDAAEARAQQIINHMPPGASRSTAQRGLDNFRRMRAAGKVRISPDPGRPLAPGGVPVRPKPNPHNAFTTAEYVIPGGGGGGGECGGTGEVGAGGKRIVLGGVPDQAPGTGGSTGSPSGDNPNTDDPGVLGAKLVHEGLRTGQDWAGDETGNPRDNSEACRRANNDYEVYMIQERYFASAKQLAQQSNDEKRADGYERFRKARLVRAWQELVRRSQLACS